MTTGLKDRAKCVTEGEGGFIIVKIYVLSFIWERKFKVCRFQFRSCSIVNVLRCRDSVI